MGKASFCGQQRVKNYSDIQDISNRLKEVRVYILRHMRFKNIVILITLVFSSILLGETEMTILSSTNDELIIQYKASGEHPDDLKPVSILIGLPTKALPSVSIERSMREAITQTVDDSLPVEIKWTNQQVLHGLETATLQITPRIDLIDFARITTILIHFNETLGSIGFPTKRQERNLGNRVINWDVSRNWVTEIPRNRSHRIVDLPDGDWIVMEIDSDGMYSFTGQTLLQQVPVNSIDISQIKLYTHSSAGRERMNDFHNRFSPTGTYQPVPENLQEVAMRVDDDGNGILNASDTFYFYGRGAKGFDQGTNISFSQNVYFSSNKYWILIPETSGEEGERIHDYNESVQNPSLLTYGRVLQRIEYDLTNPHNSGLLWVGTTISRNAVYSMNFTSSHIVPDLAGSLSLGFKGNYSASVSSAPPHSVSVHVGSTQSPSIENITINAWSQRSRTISLDLSSHSDETSLFFHLKNNSSHQASAPYFDYATFQYFRSLVFEDEPIHFFSHLNSGAVQLKVNYSNPPIIWDVTDPFQPVNHLLDGNGNIAYNSLANTYHEFIMFQTDQVTEIEELVVVPLQLFSTLRHTQAGKSHIIIGPEAFRTAAEPLREHRGSSVYAALETIYDEFSGGNADPFAIHSFLQWTQEYWANPVPEYVLILGDADFDYQNITGNSKTIVPTIEIGTHSSSHCTDDRYASFHGKIPELSIGRYPAHNENDVHRFVEKIVEFESEPELGIWRQRLTLVADDGARPYETSANLEKTHTFNSETVASLAHPAVLLNKIYTVEYPEVNDASTFGVVKPDATEAILDALSQGTAVINYIGHGSPHQWAQERLLMQDRDLDLINTGNKLPLWIAGTCSWGHFDDVDTEAFSEDIIRLVKGACGVITTTRAITFSSNEFYIEQIFNSIFPNQQVTPHPIGHILQSAKTGNTSGEYFQLLGDPATPFTIPNRSVQISHVSPDTLMTLDTGRVFASYDFSTGGSSGVIQLSDRNESVTRHYFYQSNPQSISFDLQGGTLFRGQFTSESNSISSPIRIPGDFSYSSEPGTITMYLATNGDPLIEALGHFDNVMIRGGEIVQDDEGPIISFQTESGLPLYSGDHLRQGENIRVQITDPIGVNVTGHIGHEIVMTDKDTGTELDVTDRFIYNPNSITTGSFMIHPDQGSESLEISVKAWDSANNPGEASINLDLIEERKLSLFHVYNYPNPFSHDTQFAFEVTQESEIEISIYTLSGRKIKDLDAGFFTEGYHAIDWDGKDDFGDDIANGAYLYQIKAITDDKTVTQIKTCAKFR